MKNKLNLPVIEFIRTNEDEFKQIKSQNDKFNSEEFLLKQIEIYPKLLQRPIVIVGKKAVIGRPIENLIEFI